MPRLQEQLPLVPSTAPHRAPSGNNCACCGAIVAGGTEGCHRLFEELLAKEYTDPAFGAVHLLTVDAYVLQHSEQHSPRSNAYHLIRLCWLLERGGDPRIGHGGPKLLAENHKELPFLAPPADRGAVTVVDVHGAATPAEHAARVQHWAEAVWAAWREYHDWARQAVTAL